MVLLEQKQDSLPADSPQPSIEETQAFLMEVFPSIVKWAKRCSCEIHAALITPQPGLNVKITETGEVLPDGSRQVDLRVTGDVEPIH